MSDYIAAGGRATPEQMASKHVFIVSGSIAATNTSLLVVDLVYGERAGWNLLTQLHEAATTQNIPIMLLSTSSQLLEKPGMLIFGSGGDPHLTKPSDLVDLLAIVRKPIGSNQSLQRPMLRARHRTHLHA